MNSQAKKVLWLAGLVFLGQRLSGTFVQAYLWDQGGSLAALTRFNLATYLCLVLAFLVLARIVKRGGAVTAVRLGLLLQAVFYLAVLALGSHAGRWLNGLGALSGLGLGAFWVGQNLLIQHAAPPAELGRFWGYHGAVASAVALTAPLLGGWIITGLGERLGYALLFTLGAVTFLVAGLFSAGLSVPGSARAYNLRAGLADFPDRRWRKVLSAHVFSGFQDGILGFLPIILVYAITGSALTLGNFVVITAAVGLVANWLVGRWVNRSRPFPAMLAGGLLQAAGALVLLARMDYRTLLAYNLATALFGPLSGVPLIAVTFSIVGEGAQDLRVERIIVREVALAVGRLSGMALLLALGRVVTPELTATWALGLVAVAAIGPALLFRKVGAEA